MSQATFSTSRMTSRASSMPTSTRHSSRNTRPRQEKPSPSIQSHGGSSKQASAVLDGLQADVVTFNQVTDIQLLHDQADLVTADWQSRFPNNSVPYYSLPAFLVRKGNPKNIKDWSDLVRDDVKVV